MKVFIPFRVPLNMKMLNAACTIVDSVEKADCSICGKTVPDGVVPQQCILIQSEPPLTGSRRRLYKTFQRFHTVICFNPRGPNQFPFVPDDESPALYPYNPALHYDRTREDTTITRRGVYYAGRYHAKMAKVPDCYTSYNLYGVRHAICNHLLTHYQEAHIFGQGWPNQSKSPGQPVHWRVQKQLDIAACGVDFVLCMENSMLRGYVSEKIHDGFSSGRLALYLGEPNIEKWVPPDTFVCLNGMLDPVTKAFDFAALVKMMRTISQQTYNAHVRRAALWRKSIAGGHEKMRDRMTEFVIERGKTI